MAKKRRSYPKSPNLKYKFDSKDNSILKIKQFFNDINFTNKFQIISDPNEPFIKLETKYNDRTDNDN